MRLIQLFMVWLLTSLYSITSYAIEYVDCGTISPVSELVQGGTHAASIVEQRGSGWGAKFLTKYAGHEHGYCRNKISEAQRQQFAGYRIEGFSFIDFSRTMSHNGQTYYGLKGTSSSFLNQYAYVYYRVQIIPNLATDPQTKYTIEEARNNGYLFFGNGGSAYGNWVAYGMNIVDFDMYFTQPPKDVITATLSLGSFAYAIVDVPAQIRYSPGGDRTTAPVWITVTLEPPQENTCVVSNTTVLMPAINASLLSHAYSEAGRTYFDINVNCGNGVIGEKLTFNMMDLNNSGVTFDLKNTESVTSNVSIRVWRVGLGGEDSDSDSQVVFGSTSTYYPNLGQYFNGTPVQAKFYAQYYKLDNSPVEAGKVNGQASIMVSYR